MGQKFSAFSEESNSPSNKRSHEFNRIAKPQKKSVKPSFPSTILYSRNNLGNLLCEMMEDYPSEKFPAIAFLKKLTFTFCHSYSNYYKVNLLDLYQNRENKCAFIFKFDYFDQMVPLYEITQALAQLTKDKPFEDLKNFIEAKLHLKSFYQKKFINSCFSIDQCFINALHRLSHDPNEITSESFIKSQKKLNLFIEKIKAIKQSEKNGEELKFAFFMLERNNINELLNENDITPGCYPEQDTHQHIYLRPFFFDDDRYRGNNFNDIEPEKIANFFNEKSIFSVIDEVKNCETFLLINKVAKKEKHEGHLGKMIQQKGTVFSLPKPIQKKICEKIFFHNGA